MHVSHVSHQSHGLCLSDFAARLSRDGCANVKDCCKAVERWLHTCKDCCKSVQDGYANVKTAARLSQDGCANVKDCCKAVTRWLCKCERLLQGCHKMVVLM